MKLTVANKKKKSIPVTIHSLSITVISLGLLTACSQAMSGDPRVFICDSFKEGQKDRVTLMPESKRVDVRDAFPNPKNSDGAYLYYEEPVSQEKRQQGWRRWITNAGARGIANSWNELNIKTGEYRYIGINGQVESLGHCSQEK